MVHANSSNDSMLKVHIQGYNDIAKQYNETSSDRMTWKRRVLTNLRVYVNRVISRSDKLELKKKWYILRTSPINGTLPLLSTGWIVPVTQSTSNKVTSQFVKGSKLSIKESTYQRISEEYDFKVYESAVTATDWDIILEKIDLVQFWTGEGINIWELYKRDYGGNMLKLANSKDTRDYKFYKRDGNPWISFDLFTGLDPGMKIWNGETVKFTIKIDSSSFADGKDFQKTNIFLVKYKIKWKEWGYDQSLSRWVFYDNAEESYVISGSTPQILVYNICDEWVKVSSDSTPIVFNEYFQRDLYSTGRVSDRSLDWLAMPIQNYYTRNLGSDLNAYQNDIREKFTGSGITYATWLSSKYISSLVEAYENKDKPWLFYGYKSKVNSQFKSANGMQCKDIVDVAKIERTSFKTTYEELKVSENQKKLEQLSERVTELEALNAGCTIKGNVNFDTWEKIFHIPWSRFYSETVINTLYGERWFCNESDAVNAWWRKEQGY